MSENQVLILVVVIVIAVIAVACDRFCDRRASGGARNCASASDPNMTGCYRRKATRARRRACWSFARSGGKSSRCIRCRRRTNRASTSAGGKCRARFVDDPRGAVTVADGLVTEVMQKRGYPIGEFEQRAADISVDHPVVVENYRAAHAIALRHSSGQASTEDLRQAMVHYRALFQELLDERQPQREPIPQRKGA